MKRSAIAEICVVMTKKPMLNATPIQIHFLHRNGRWGGRGMAVQGAAQHSGAARRPNGDTEAV